MAIPAPNDAGWLDPNDAPYVASLDDVEAMFVTRAPTHQERRARIFEALQLHTGLMIEQGGQEPGSIWLHGDFISHIDRDPRFAEVVYLCRDTDHFKALMAEEGIFQLLTLESLFAERPAFVNIAQLRPVGGFVNAYLATPNRYMYWAYRCSLMRGVDGRWVAGTRRGFIEVRL